MQSLAITRNCLAASPRLCGGFRVENRESKKTDAIDLAQKMKRIFPRVSIASAHILNANIREIKRTMKQNGHLFMIFCKNDQKKQRLFCRDFFSFWVFKSFFPKNSFKSRFLPVRLQRQSFLQRLVVAVSQSQIQSHKTAARARMEALTL